MKAFIAALTFALASTLAYSPPALASSTNVSASPNPTTPGHTVTVAGTVTLAGSGTYNVSNASVNVWLLNGGSTVATANVHANFIVGQPTNVSIPVALPSTAPTGPYSVALGVYDGSNQMFWTGTAASLTVSSPTASGVKWHPGHYAGSNSVVSASNSNWTDRKAEIDLALSQPNVKGYFDIHQWGSIETAQGVYNFANIDQARSYIATTYPGKRYGFIIFFESYGGNTSTGTGLIPAYVLNNPATYGSAGSPDGTGGWLRMGAGTGTGRTAAWWRPAVAARVEALFAALAAHTSPYGSGAYTYDTDPFVEMVTWNESAIDLSSNSGSGDYSFAATQTQWNNINAAIVQAFQHTNVVDQNNFFGWTDTNVDNTEQIEITGRDQGLALGGPDIFNGNRLTWGQTQYLGKSAHTTAMFGVAPYIAFVQTPDYAQNSLSVMFTLATGSATTPVPNEGLNASQIWWEMLRDGSAGDWQTKVVPFINAHPIPTGNTVCPTKYSPRGGCNTN